MEVVKANSHYVIYLVVAADSKPEVCRGKGYGDQRSAGF